jgi:hypothetical protein
LEALHWAGSRWQVGFDGADWWSRIVGYYPIGDEMNTWLKERGDEKHFYRTCGEEKR